MDVQPLFHEACAAECPSRRALESTGDFWRLSPVWDRWYRKAECVPFGIQSTTLALLHLLAAHQEIISQLHQLHLWSFICVFIPQCHPARDGQRGKCWCVDQKTGMRLPGPPEPRGDLDCHQLTSTTLRDWAGRRGREMQDQLSSTGAYLWSQMRRGLCPRGLAPHGWEGDTWTGVTTATPFKDVL